MYRTDTVRLSEYEAFVVAHLKGEVDVANAGTIETELSQAVPNTAAGLIIDLSEVPFMDSSGLRLLFEVDERLRRHQQDLRIVLPKGSGLFRTLALVHMQDVVPILEDVASAAAADGLPVGVPGVGS